MRRLNSIVVSRVHAEQTVCGECTNDECDIADCDGRCIMEEDDCEKAIEQLSEKDQKYVDEYGLLDDDQPWVYECPDC